ncbi:MAG: peptidoglycan editing factor PgeF [Candidatus Accumulibacter sp.]|nr:peptidoglycan editing factor PgeF [Accumulibacter sp.]
MKPPNDWIVPEWPAPEGVRALSTTRQGGGREAGRGRFSGFNLGAHVGDNEKVVARNRARLIEKTGVMPVWLNQTHGTRVVDIGDPALPVLPEADGAVVRIPGRACVVMTADCLPVLFCDTRGSVAAAAHAGWRGLCAGILEAVVRKMDVSGDEILAWLGPAIGPLSFEVDGDVRRAFTGSDSEAGAEKAFAVSKIEGKWLADLYCLARRRLERLGIEKIYGGGLCTLRDVERFFSYRRDGQTGRMASLVWLARHQ